MASSTVISIIAHRAFSFAGDTFSKQRVSISIIRALCDADSLVEIFIIFAGTDSIAGKEVSSRADGARGQISAPGAALYARQADRSLSIGRKWARGIAVPLVIVGVIRASALGILVILVSESRGTSRALSFRVAGGAARVAFDTNFNFCCRG